MLDHHAIIHNFYDYVSSVASFSEGKCIKGDGFYALNTGLDHPIFNYICNVNNEDHFLEKAVNTFLKHKIPFYLCNGLLHPHSKPTEILHPLDLGPLIPLDGMIFDLKDALPTVDSPELEFQWAESPKQLKQWIEFSAAAKEHTVEQGIQFFQNYEPSQTKLLLASLDGKPVGCSMICFGNKNYAGNYWDSVIPTQRKQGIGSQMIRKRLECARDAGFKYVVVQCMDSSTRVYQSLGFQKVCEVELYAVMDPNMKH